MEQLKDKSSVKKRVHKTGGLEVSSDQHGGSKNEFYLHYW